MKNRGVKSSIERSALVVITEMIIITRRLIKEQQTGCPRRLYHNQQHFSTLSLSATTTTCVLERTPPTLGELINYGMLAGNRPVQLAIR